MELDILSMLLSMLDSITLVHLATNTIGSPADVKIFVAWSEQARELRNFNRIHKYTRAAIPYVMYLPDVSLLYMAVFGSLSSIYSSFLLPRWYFFRIFLSVTVLNCLVSESMAKNSTKAFIA